MSRTQGRLRQQLLLPLLFFEAVSLLVIGLAAFLVYQGQLRATLSLQQEVAANVAGDIEAYLGDLQASLMDVGLNENLRRLTPDQQSEALSRLQARQSSYVVLAIVDEQGQEQARLAFRTDTPVLPDEWEQHEALPNIVIGETYNGAVEFHGGLPYMLMAVPIRDPQLRITGMLVAQVDLSPLWNVVATAGSGQSGYVYTIDQAGNLVAARDVALVMRQPDVTGLQGVQAALSDGQPTVAYQGLLGASVIGGMGRVRGIGWKVIAELPTSEAYAYLRSLLVLLGFQVLIGIILAIGVWFYINSRVIGPILEITRGAQRIGDGHLDQRVEIRAGGELADLARVLNSTTAQLQNLIGSLEQRVADRTADLERRSVQLEAAAQVARTAAAIRDVGHLLEETVRLISDRFGFYHAGIFLLDEVGEYAVLRAASSEGGQKMLARGHKLRVGEVGIVGNVAASSRSRIALDVGKDAVFFDNPDLPLTRSEMALPLEIRDRVIGALDVQSTEPGAFSDEDVAILQTLADQLALAIENARLLEESQSALRELEALYGQRVREAWRERTARQPATYLYDRVGVEPASSPLAPEMEALLSRGRSTVAQGEGIHQLTAPIRLRGQSLGTIALRQGPEEEPWSAEELALVDDISTQIGLALENARLFEEVQQRAGRLAVVNRIAAAAGAALSLDSLLETVHKEVAPAFQPDAFFVALYDEEANELEFRYNFDEGARQPVERYAMGQGLSSVVVARKKPLFIHNQEQMPERLLPLGTGRLPISWLGVPLLIGERVIGVINVQSYSPNVWSEEDELLLSTIADQVAVAVENVRLFEQARIRAEELAVLNELAQALTARLSVKEVLEEAHRGASRLLDTTNFTIGLYDPGKDVIDFAFTTVESETDRQIVAIPASQGVSGYIVRNRTPVLIKKDYAKWAAERGIESVGQQALSWVGAPLLVGGQPLGVMSAQSYATPNLYDEHDRDLLAAIANQVAIALQSARLFEDARTRAEELVILNEMARALTASTSIDEVLEEAYKGVARLLRTQSFYVGLYDPKKSEIYFPFDVSESDEDRQITAIPADQGLTGYVVQNRTSVLIGENMEEKLKEMGIESIGGDSLSWLGVPMMVGDQVMGVMVVQSYTATRAYDEHDRGLLMAAASQTAIAIQSARLFEQAQRRAWQERQIYEVTSKLRRSPDITTILQTAVDELGRTLRVDRALVRLTTKPQEEREDMGQEAIEKTRT